jgi:Sel1 repeat
VQRYCDAIARGNPRALNNLANLHVEGNGVPRDIDEARSLWRQSAERGNPNAMFNLGRSYLFGPGEPIDKREGTTWILRAAGLGHGPAQQMLRQSGYKAPLPPPVDTAGMMRIVPKDASPGRARVCSTLISRRLDFYGNSAVNVLFSQLLPKTPVKRTSTERFGTFARVDDGKIWLPGPAAIYHRFCVPQAVSLEWLVEGVGNPPPWEPDGERVVLDQAPTSVRDAFEALKRGPKSQLWLLSNHLFGAGYSSPKAPDFAVCIVCAR